MIFANLFRMVFLITITLVVVGCATPPPPFPKDQNARKHYDAGDRFLEEQRYEMAAVEYENSLQLESGAYITHSKLAVAYFGQEKFSEAAQQFEESYQLWGGPSSGPAWAIMQAVTLQRSGDKSDAEKAEKLLKQWTGSGILAIATGQVISSGEPLSGFTEKLAKYLLGYIDENNILASAKSNEKPLIYLTFAISNAAKGDIQSAKKFLQLAEGVVPTHGWQFALVRAEKRNLKIETPTSELIHKPTSKQLIYMACLSSEIQRVTAKGESNPEAVAHFYCQVFSGSCEQEPEKESCQNEFKKYELELNKNGDSLLYQAAWIGDHRIVQAMVSAGVNIDYTIKKGVANTEFGAGWTPLLIASAEGQEAVVSVLTKGGANVNAKNNLGRTSLMFASNYGFYSIAKMLLENGANTDEIPNDENGWPAIISASYKGHDDIVKLLVDHGADPNIADKNGITALKWAENQGNTEVVELLKTTR